MPGAFKNALDWLVGVWLGRRPIGLVDITPRSRFVQAQLREILTTMDGVLPDATQVTIDFAARPESVAAIVADSRAAAALVDGISAMLRRLD